MRERLQIVTSPTRKNDEALRNAPRPLPVGRTARLVETVAAIDGEEEEAATQR
jgi:hypothetical protein